MPWPRAAAGAVKEAIWTWLLACNVTRSLECQTRANFFSDTFAVRATDGCTMLCYVPYTFVHGCQFSVSIFDRAPRHLLFPRYELWYPPNELFSLSLSYFRLRIVFFFFWKINLRNKKFSLAKYRSVRNNFIRRISLRTDISRKRDKSIYVERNKRGTFELNSRSVRVLLAYHREIRVATKRICRWKDGWVGEKRRSSNRWRRGWSTEDSKATDQRNRVGAHGALEGVSEYSRKSHSF